MLRDFVKECIWLFMNVRNKLLAAELRPPELAFMCSARAPAESRAGAGGGGKQRWARASTRRFCFETFSSRRLVLLPHWVPFEVEVGELGRGWRSGPAPSQVETGEWIQSTKKRNAKYKYRLIKRQKLSKVCERFNLIDDWTSWLNESSKEKTVGQGTTH